MGEGLKIHPSDGGMDSKGNFKPRDEKGAFIKKDQAMDKLHSEASEINEIKDSKIYQGNGAMSKDGKFVPRDQSGRFLNKDKVMDVLHDEALQMNEKYDSQAGNMQEGQAEASKEDISKVSAEKEAGVDAMELAVNEGAGNVSDIMTRGEAARAPMIKNVESIAGNELSSLLNLSTQFDNEAGKFDKQAGSLKEFVDQANSMIIKCQEKGSARREVAQSLRETAKQFQQRESQANAM